MHNTTRTFWGRRSIFIHQRKRRILDSNIIIWLRAKTINESCKSSDFSFGGINAQCLRQYGVTVCCFFYIIYSVRLAGSFLLENKLKWNDVKKEKKLYASEVLFNFFGQAFPATWSDKCTSVRSISQTDFDKTQNNRLITNRNKTIYKCAKFYHPLKYKTSVNVIARFTAKYDWQILRLPMTKSQNILWWL